MAAGSTAPFWINAYNAFVLRAVIDSTRLRQVADYPANSIRQIPGRSSVASSGPPDAR